MYLIQFPDNTPETKALRYSGTKESRTQAVRIARFHNSILGLALHRSWPTLPSVRSPILSVPRTGLLSSLRQPCEPFHLLPLSPISHYLPIVPPKPGATTSGLLSPRQFHPSTISFIARLLDHLCNASIWVPIFCPDPLIMTAAFVFHGQ